MLLENHKIVFSKTTNIIIKTAAFVGAVTVILGAYSFYLNNFWKPKVEIIQADFNTGVAQVKVGKDIITIYGDATFLIESAGDWGVRFGSTNGKYDRLELTKKGMVVEYIKK